MGFTRTVLEHGIGDHPEKGDEITVEYNAYLYNEEMQCRGRCFDSRKEFKTLIGIGKVIKGWDEGLMEMTLGERSILRVSSDYAYGEGGFPGHIPPSSTLEFDIRLHDISHVKTEAAPGDGNA